MKTKFSLEEITDTASKLNYRAYQKKFEKELKYIKAGENVPCFVISHYEFADKKIRPMLIFGLDNRWREYLKTAVKTNKFFGQGTCLKKEGDASALNLQIKKGKVKENALKKALLKYPPSSKIKFEVGILALEEVAAEAPKDERVDNLKEKAGFKMLGKSTYAKIKLAIAAFKKLAGNQYDEKMRLIDQILELTDDWVEKHPKDKPSSDAKKHQELELLKKQLQKARLAVIQHRNSDQGEALDKFNAAKTAYDAIALLNEDAYFDRKAAYEAVLLQIMDWKTRYDLDESNDITALKTQITTLRDLIDEDIRTNTEQSGKGQIVNLDPGDRIIDDAAADIKSRKKGLDSNVRAQGSGANQQDQERQSDLKTIKDAVDFSLAGKDAPIVLLAHGAPRYPNLLPTDSAKTYASNFGDKGPQAIVKYLLKNKLPLSYAGVIYLDGCYTASGNTAKNFAMQVYKMLVKKGYMYLQIKGNLGAAATLKDGTELVTHAAVENAAEQLELKLKKLKAGSKKLQNVYIGRKNEIIKKEMAPKLKERNSLKKELALLQKEAPTEARSQEAIDAEITAHSTEISAMSQALDNLELKINGVNDEEANDTKLIAVKAAIKNFTQKLESMTMPALTGTFGPEKLPPKA